MSKLWRFKTPNLQLQAEFSHALKEPLVVAGLLVNRGITDVDSARAFLRPSLADLPDPFLLKDMDKAVARVRHARDKNEQVMIYGDYDVDGITSTAVLWRCLKSFGLSAVKYIPHRMEEGYGLNYEIVPLAKKMGVTLLITVDCGITSFGEVEALHGEGIDVIVIDHHEPEGDSVPSAVAVVDPKRPDCDYPFRDLAGVGLAAKFSQALLGKFPEEDLDLITLGTVADVVPLRGENRVFALFGLPMIAKTKKKGLKALIQTSRAGGRDVSPHTVGFVLGPRLNAAGRMGTAHTSLDLLLAEDDLVSMELASSLEAYNRERQRLQTSVVEEALALIKGDTAFQDEHVLVVHGEGWHKGVLGIAASRIADKYGRPAIVISLNEGVGTGSARSVEGFALNEALAHCRDLLEAFGGHKRAAGLTVRNEQIAEFRSRINLFAKEILTVGPASPVLEIDGELPFPQVDMALLKVLAMLEPHGEGNPAPVFATRRVLVKTRPQTLGRGTLKFWATDGRATFSVVGFGMAEANADLRMGQAVDIAYNLAIDDWNKAPQVQLVLKDLKVLTK